RKICDQLNAPQSVLIVGNKDVSSVGNSRYYESEADYLRTQGFESDLVKPVYFANPDTGKKYSIALKHFLSEYSEILEIPIDEMRAAHRETTFIVPDSGRSLSSKSVFAWLSTGSV